MSISAEDVKKLRDMTAAGLMDAKKALNNNIKKNQTGPAARKDFKTIEKHLTILSKTKKKKYIDIYKSITNSILSNHEN